MRSSLPEKIKEIWRINTEKLSEMNLVSYLPLPVYHEPFDMILGQIVEYYIMSKAAETLLPWFKHSTLRADRAMHLQILCLRDRSQSELGIIGEFQSNQDNAIKELCKIESSMTPLEKLIVLKNVCSLIRQNIQINIEKNNYSQDIEMSTDDLISIIIYVIIQASYVYIDIPADIRYILKFHFVNTSCSELGFTLCNFRVCVHMIIPIISYTKYIHIHTRLFVILNLSFYFI
jgi:hypothetical protein